MEAKLSAGADVYWQGDVGPIDFPGKPVNRVGIQDLKSFFLMFKAIFFSL